MANNIPITTGTGAASVAGETVGGITYQQIEVYGGGGASVLGINPDGSINASIIGKATVTFSGSPSISGAVTIVGTPSISGTVNIAGTPSISGAVAIVGSPSIYGNISGSVAAFQGGSWSTSVVGGPVTLYAPATSYVSGVTSVMTGTGVVSVLNAAPGGQRNYVTHILVTNQQASVTGAGTQVNIIDDGSGQVVYAGYAAAGGGGFSVTMPTPLRQPTSTFSLSAKALTQASVIVSASGYTAT